MSQPTNDRADFKLVNGPAYRIIGKGPEQGLGLRKQLRFAGYHTEGIAATVADDLGLLKVALEFLHVTRICRLTFDNVKERMGCEE